MTLGGPRRPKTAQDGPKTAQDPSKRLPEAPQTPLRASKDPPKMPQEAAKTLQEAPKSAQDPPQDPPRPLQNDQKSTQDRPKMVSKSLFRVLLFFSPVCSSLSLLSSLFSLLSFSSIFFIRSSLLCPFSSFFFLLSSLSLSLSFVSLRSCLFSLFCLFSSLCFLVYLTAGGSFTYWGALGAILERPLRQSDFGSILESIFGSILDFPKSPQEPPRELHDRPKSAQ